MPNSMSGEDPKYAQACLSRASALCVPGTVLDVCPLCERFCTKGVPTVCQLVTS